MKVQLRNPDKIIELKGERVISDVLDELDINPETILVILNGTLVMPNTLVSEDETIELRPVISGGES